MTLPLPPQPITTTRIVRWRRRCWGIVWVTWGLTFLVLRTAPRLLLLG